MDISTSKGLISTRNIGKGKKILFLHGGPGMSHKYLVPAFKGMSHDYELIFIDQLGCGDSQATTTVTTSNNEIAISELLAQLELEKENYTIIAHSYGACLLGALLDKEALPKLPQKIILLNPAPFSKVDFGNILNHLFSKLSSTEFSEVTSLINEGSDQSGEKVAEIMSPYFNGHNNKIDDLGKVEYRLESYKSMVESQSDFDHYDTYESIKERIHFIFGETDYIDKSYFERYLTSENNTTLKGGHFSFAENSKVIQQLIEELVL